uniref:Uncharacterized protein n=1 Tax=Parastrongyloides trichosuri TaxID=131310 RepID=A0A0N4Z4Q5_PARTI
MSCSVNTTARFIILLISLITYLQTCHALTCYENKEDGSVVAVRNETWKYCAIVPALNSAYGTSEGRMFGLGPQNDWTEAYDNTFAFNDNMYKVLTVCILEKYDFSSISPKMNFGQTVEFIFRCVCNYDRCNSASTFNGYINSMKRDSF